MANYQMCLEAAHKACPNNPTHRTVYLAGFNEGFDQAVEMIKDWAERTYLHETASPIRKVCFKQLVEKLESL